MLPKKIVLRQSSVWRQKHVIRHCDSRRPKPPPPLGTRARNRRNGSGKSRQHSRCGVICTARVAACSVGKQRNGLRAWYGHHQTARPAVTALTPKTVIQSGLCNSLYVATYHVRVATMERVQRLVQAAWQAVVAHPKIAAATILAILVALLFTKPVRKPAGMQWRPRLAPPRLMPPRPAFHLPVPLPTAPRRAGAAIRAVLAPGPGFHVRLWRPPRQLFGEQL